MLPERSLSATSEIEHDSWGKLNDRKHRRWIAIVKGFRKLKKTRAQGSLQSMTWRYLLRHKKQSMSILLKRGPSTLELKATIFSAHYTLCEKTMILRRLSRTNLAAEKRNLKRGTTSKSSLTECIWKKLLQTSKCFCNKSKWLQNFQGWCRPSKNCKNCLERLSSNMSL